MVNLKKYNVGITQIVLFLTFLAAGSCATRQYNLNRIEGREIPVTEQSGQSQAIEDYIRPFRENIDKNLNTVLAYSPETLDKSKGEWQTSIGSLMADAVLKQGGSIFGQRERKPADIALLNFGGIRSVIPKGDVTTRTAFEIMPFENSLVVATLKGAQILELIQYIIDEKKAHPLAGLTFTIGADRKPRDIMVQGNPLKPNKTYHVVTSDYLLNGGDKMDFFKKSERNYDLDYKIRNVLIDYFKEVDTLPMITDIRIRKMP